MSYRLITKKLVLYKNPWNIGLIALFLWAVLSGILNKDLISTLLAFAILLYFALSVYLENNFDTVEKIENILKYFIYFSLFSALLGIIEKLTFMYWDSAFLNRLLGITSEILKNHRIYSTFGNPNVTGTWFTAMIFICIYLSSLSTRNYKIFYNSSILLFLFCLYLTGSRGAEIGLITGLLAYYLTKKNKKTLWYFIPSLFILAFILFSPFQIFNFKNLMYREISSSFTNRYSIWEGCLKMIQIKPIAGWGLMGIYNHGAEYIHINMRVFHGHNIWISFMTTLGSVGLLIYLYMKFYVFKGIYKLYRNDCRLVPLFAGIQVMVIGQGLVDFTIMTPQAGILFMSCSALIISLTRKYTVSSKKLQTDLS